MEQHVMDILDGHSPLRDSTWLLPVFMEQRANLHSKMDRFTNALTNGTLKPFLLSGMASLTAAPAAFSATRLRYRFSFKDLFGRNSLIGQGRHASHDDLGIPNRRRSQM